MNDPEVVQKRRETMAKYGEGELIEPDSARQSADGDPEGAGDPFDYHEADSTGFPDGERCRS